MSGSGLIRFSNVFVFADPNPPIINNQYGWSGMFGHCKLCFFYVFICDIFCRFLMALKFHWNLCFYILFHQI